MVRPCTDTMLPCFFCFLFIVVFAAAAPTRRRPDMVYQHPTAETVDYLTQFGYLPESDKETGNLRTDDQLIEAIGNLQKFAGLPRTGRLDQATKELMTRPRCGVPDPVTEGRKKRYAIQGQVWSHTNLTWSLRTWFTHGLDHGRTRYDLFQALSIWSDHSKLTFREVNGDHGDILVYFEKGYHGDGYPFDGKGQVLAHAFFPGTGRGGDVHFDIEETWHLTGDADNNGEKTSLLSVAAHEFGHSLGLAHSSVPGALMYPWYQGFGSLDLHDDDKLAIQQIYGAKEKQWGKNTGQKPSHRWPPRPGVRPIPTTTVRTTTTTTTTPRTRPTRPTEPTTTDAPEAPDTCNTSYDAISLIRGEMFIFKGRYLWRVGDKGVRRGYPALIELIWSAFPKNFTNVDAVYERLDKKIVFFIGKYYYVFQGNFLDPGYPKPLAHLGLPESLPKIDAAVIWSHNSKTYLFSGSMYWKLDEESGKVELDYPRDIQRVWKGVAYDIDTAFQWSDGSTYFFKGTKFWRFNDYSMKLIDEPKESSEFWMHCPPKPGNHPTSNDIPTDRPKIKHTHKDEEPSGASSVAPTYLMTLLLLFIINRVVNNS